MNFNRLLVGSKVGTLTGFIRYSKEQYVGLSAFHVLTGSNNNIDIDKDIVKIRNEVTSRWINLGRTIDGRYSWGNGSINEYGKLDYAIFQMTDSIASKIVDYLKLVPISRLLNEENLSSIKGHKVFGLSTTNKNYIQGTIADVFYENNLKERFDIVIELDNGYYTNSGDSGMLWRDSNGHALSMHIRGNNNEDSTKSYSTIIKRITRIYDSELFEIVN